VDHDRSATSRGLLNRLQASGRFQLAGASASLERANDAMLSRDVEMIVVLPAGCEKDVVTNRSARVQLIMNAEDGASAGVTHSYAAQIVAGYARELAQRVRPEPDGQGGRSVRAAAAPAVDVRVRGWYNPELNYRDYMVPGILVQLVTVIGTLITAMNIVREKEIGTLDQLSVTPLGRGTFIAAKLLPLWIIALVELTLGLVVARVVFDVPLEGSIPLIFLAASVYLVAALGIGLFVSTLANTQQQAMFVTFFIVMIYLLMSGLFTPVRSMPDWAQWMAQVNPVKHFIVIMRAVMLKGASLSDIAVPLGALALLGATVLTGRASVRPAGTLTGVVLPDAQRHHALQHLLLVTVGGVTHAGQLVPHVLQEDEELLS
jgi:ABC-2 type transport system permease protein